MWPFVSGFIPLAQSSEAGVSTSFFSVAKANVLLSDSVNLQARHGPPPQLWARTTHRTQQKSSKTQPILINDNSYGQKSQKVLVLLILLWGIIHETK